MYGRINSSWRVERDVLTYRATIPANTTATLYLPAIEASNVSESGKKLFESGDIRFIKVERGKAVYELSSGDYSFTSAIQLQR
jgi:alpha-L-rhamnosidase